MRQPKSRYRAERQFRRAVWNGRFNGSLFLVVALICLILGAMSAAAGNIGDFAGFGLMAAMCGAGGLWSVRFKRRPNWLEIAVLREQQERNRERDDRGAGDRVP